MPYEVESKKCDLCLECIDECPKKAIQLSTSWGKKEIWIDDDLCIDCRKCEDVCPNDAIFHWYFK